MQLQTEGLEKFQAFLTNPIDWGATRHKKIAAIIGDAPSTYAKSPIVWNAGFEALGIDALFLPFDVPPDQLKGLLETMRQEPRFLGFSVTVPYKLAVIPLLDELDPKAKAIGAVNTVARTKEGRLIGYNTDGQGGLDSLLKIPPSGSEPFLRSLKGKNVLLIGAGGAARSLSFYLAEALEKGKLYLANRDLKKGETLCGELNQRGAQTVPLPEKEIPRAAKGVDLIINATTKGQHGLRRLPDGSVTCLEPYSALTPATPPSLRIESDASFFSSWIRTAWREIEKNNQNSLEILRDVPPETVLFDIVYAPLETVFLRQGRWTGHQTLNGKTMNIAQAADGFCRKVLKETLETMFPDPEQTYQKVFQAMQARW